MNTKQSAPERGKAIRVDRVDCEVPHLRRHFEPPFLETGRLLGGRRPVGGLYPTQFRGVALCAAVCPLVSVLVINSYDVGLRSLAVLLLRVAAEFFEAVPSVHACWRDRTLPTGGSRRNQTCGRGC